MLKEIGNNVKKDLAEFKETMAIIDKAKVLLDKYGASENIPVEDFDPLKTGFDDATLLAFCEVLENDQKRGKDILLTIGTHWNNI